MSALPTVTVPCSRLKLLAVLAGALAFIALAWWMHVSPRAARIDGVRRAAAFYGGIPFAVLAASLVLRRLLDRRPALIVDDDGIWTDFALRGAGRIAWSEIARVELVRYGHQAMIGIWYRDLATVLARFGLLRRWYVRLNVLCRMAPMTIPRSELPLPLEQLHELLSAYLLARGLQAASAARTSAT